MNSRANIALDKAPENTDTLMNIEKMKWAMFCQFVDVSSEQMQNHINTRWLVSNGFILIELITIPKSQNFKLERDF